VEESTREKEITDEPPVPIWENTNTRSWEKDTHNLNQLRDPINWDTDLRFKKGETGKKDKDSEPRKGQMAKGSNSAFYVIDCRSTGRDVPG